MNQHQQQALLQQAAQHFQAGRLDEAQDHCQTLLAMDPLHPVANHLQGLIMAQTGNMVAGAGHLKTALQRDPQNAEILANMAKMLMATGEPVAAQEALTRAAQLRPSWPMPHFHLAALHRAADRNDTAITHLRTAIKLEPRFVEAHFNLGNALAARGKTTEAVAAFTQTIALNDKLPQAFCGLAQAHADLGEPVKALHHVERALALDAQSHAAFLVLVQVFRGGLEPFADSVSIDAIYRLLRACFAYPNIDHVELTSIALALMMQMYPEATWRSSIDDDAALLLRAVRDGDDGLGGLLRDPLVRDVLERVHICDPLLEQLFTSLRRRLLLDVTVFEGVQQSDDGCALVDSLAVQCVANEYVWQMGDDEIAYIAEHQGEWLEDTTSPSWQTRRALLLAYMPLDATAWRPLSAPDSARASSGQRRLDAEYHGRSEERTIMTSIESFGAMANTVSRRVREQYEQNPYPRWHAINQQSAGTVAEVVRADVYPSAPNAKCLSGVEKPKVLIAGCGTGKHAVSQALRYRDATIVAVDLSRASLAHAVRKAREFGVENLRFMHGDILELGDLGETFDVIECSGVLHHMEEPMSGWKALASVLAPGGLMKVALYSATARRHINAARAALETRWPDSSLEAIRAARQWLFGLETSDPRRQVAASQEFYATSMVRDLLFHEQEHQFSLDQVQACLDELGAQCLGFATDPHIKAAYQTQFPGDTEACDVRRWREFEMANPDTFAGMYQFWLTFPAAGV
ncbi:MAG: tetratricopeptide repeat protein [Gammaproteobacteria bacterium]